MSVSTSLTDRAVQRAAEARRQRRRRLLRSVGVLVVVVGLAGAAGWLLLGSSVLGVSTVRVTGQQRLAAPEVAQQADIDPGAPLLRLDSAGIARRVAALPPVLAVDVERDWPSTVVIRIRERVPAAVQQRGTSWVLVDRSGVEFATERRRPRGLPLVSAPVDQGPAALRATLDVLDALPAPVRAQVRQVRAATTERLSLQLSRGRTVEWGSLEHSRRKAAVLAVLLTRKASVYDVSAPDMPTTRR